MRRLNVLLSVLLIAGACAAGVAWATVTGTDADDTLTGTAGDDSLYGRGGDDTLDGLSGNDDLDGGAGADTLRGGPGNDAVSYGHVAASVRVSLDGDRNDGAAGEGDHVTGDVESAYGGNGDDTLSGNGRENTMDGGDGNDAIDGGAGFDGLYGGDGDDVIDAKDRTADDVDCGPGTDTVRRDPGDVVRNCERRGTGRALPSLRATGTIVNAWLFTSAYAIVDTLKVRDVQPTPAGVDVRCTGRRCPFRRKAMTVSASSQDADFTAAFKGRKLPLGTLIEVRITAPSAVGKYVGYTVRKSRLPGKRTRCLAPGSAKPIPCP